ncbi:polysaccharide deacetylase family protein [Thermodesulfobacteriota bacterium]
MALFFSLLLSLGVLCMPGMAVADLHVLIYHRFGEDRYPTTNVAVESFHAQMAYLKANGYQVVSLASVALALKENRSLPERAVVITIDDGYASAYTRAWPILKEFRYPFTIFLNMQAVNDGYHNILNWQQITEMRAGGVDIQDHSYAHHRLANWPPQMTESAYRKWIRADLQKGADILAERMGARPKFLAIPYGEYNRIVIDEAIKVGYQAILTQDPGAVSSTTSRFQIPREPILGNQWATMEHFAMILNRNDLPCREVQPPLVPLVGSQPFHISTRLLHPQRYQPGSLDIYVSELGWLPATLHGDQLRTDQPVKLSRRLNRVAIAGKEQGGGRTAIRFWMLIRPDGT